MKLDNPLILKDLRKFYFELNWTQNEIDFCNGDLELFRYRYNHIRPHQSLNMKTPAEAYFNLQNRLKESTKKKAQKW
jgi:transposase InsO family protein